MQEKFSSPKELAETLHEKGFKTVWMLDPGIKAETGYFVYDSGSAQDLWVLSSKGEPYIGKHLNAFQIIALQYS
jgi:alpha-glucosidase